MLKEIKTAIQKKQIVTIRLNNGDIMQGIPDACTDRVTMRSVYGPVWVPLDEIKHVSRLIKFERKKDPVRI
ncbi:hypothetical protein [Paenibacillus sp. GCM10028914]|uniref:hypothetical protein n=1 Tax=Paenibacillus sp. GCM10028914 TaxID=3273416 RepID=UPI003621E25D